MRWTLFVRTAAMLVAQSAQLQSKLSAKGLVREKRKLDPKLPTGATDVKALPRRRDYDGIANPDAAWSQAVDDATDNFGRVGRGKSTSNEHDVYMWAFGEYLHRQGFGAFVRRVEPGQKEKATSSTGRLAPAYEDDGVTMRVVSPQMLLAYVLDMAAGSEETPKGGHPDDRPFSFEKGVMLMPKARVACYISRGNGGAVGWGAPNARLAVAGSGLWQWLGRWCWDPCVRSPSQTGSGSDALPCAALTEACGTEVVGSSC